MTELGLILFGALLVNNFVLAQFLGLCPFMGITRSVDTAFATGLATAFVLALAAVTSHTLYHYLLVPLNLTYLNIIVFIIRDSMSIDQCLENKAAQVSPMYGCEGSTTFTCWCSDCIDNVSFSTLSHNVLRVYFLA